MSGCESATRLRINIMKTRLNKRSRQCALLVLLSQPVLAYAYIDPNSSGIIFQLLAPVFAAVVGVWLFMRRLIADFLRGVWRRLTGKADR
jgi:hypothetical protein